MARAIRAVTVERGRDPRDMALMAFGGSGPVHAVEVAGLLGIRTVIDLRGESERAANPCIGADRADLVLAGCAILEAIRKRWPSERMRVADRGLREGLLNEMMGRDGAWRRAGRRYRARMRAGAHGEGNRK